MTAVAVAIGHRLGGVAGTVAALLGLTLPAFVSTVALTAAYRQLQDTRASRSCPVHAAAGALSLVVAAAVNLAGRQSAAARDGAGRGPR